MTTTTHERIGPHQPRARRPPHRRRLLDGEHECLPELTFRQCPCRIGRGVALLVGFRQAPGVIRQVSVAIREFSAHESTTLNLCRVNVHLVTDPVGTARFVRDDGVKNGLRRLNATRGLDREPRDRYTGLREEHATLGIP